MTPEQWRARLEDELGDTAPSGIRELDGDRLELLTGALREAKEHQERALDEAIDSALGVIPRMARGPVRKVLGR